MMASLVANETDVQSRCMVRLIVTRSVRARPKIEAIGRLFNVSKPVPSPQSWRSLRALCNSRWRRLGRSGCSLQSAEIRSPFLVSAVFSSFRWRVESRLQSPQFPSLSHGCSDCRACRPVESEGPCARFPAVFVGWSGRQLVGCRRCRDTVVRRGVRRQILEVLGTWKAWKAWSGMGGCGN